MSKRTYNMVLHETGACPEGELFTDKELEKFKTQYPMRDWPRVCRVKVYNEDVYFSFGVRFAAVIQEVLYK